MKEKKCVIKSSAITPASQNTFSENSQLRLKLPHQLLSYYKSKCEKLEKDFDYLVDVLDQVKSACDLSDELQKELSERNEEISKLQMIVGELQIQLFNEKEQKLKLSAENDMLKIEEYENKKRIKALLLVTGVCERKSLHFVTRSCQEKLMEAKLPNKLQELKDSKQKETLQEIDSTDPQNHLLASELEEVMRLRREEVGVLLRQREASAQERREERRRLEGERDLLSERLRESQGLVCEASERLVKWRQAMERERAAWREERSRFLEALRAAEAEEGVDMSEVLGDCGGGRPRERVCGKKESTKEKKESVRTEKEEMAAFYEEQVLALEAEVNRLRERAQVCKNTFREKTEKMTAHVCYLKNKYEDLDRRRQLEAEGFRTDIRMLKERVKELEKKLAKTSSSFQSPDRQHLLMSARSTLNRAKQLEKELAFMKWKISALDANEEVVT